MQSFAVIPAAGRSQRMGQPKLLLPWGGSTMIEHVLGVWRESRVGHVLVVVHPLDARLAEVCASRGAEVVQPAIAPGDMKASVRAALAHVARYQPSATDAWLLAPADIPGLKVETIDALLDAYEASLAKTGSKTRLGEGDSPIFLPDHPMDGARRKIGTVPDGFEASSGRVDSPRIWAPRYGTRRGHPVLFPWSLAAEVERLADDQGVNVLLSRHAVEFVEAGQDSICEDLDTPEDYERLRARYGM